MDALVPGADGAYYGATRGYDGQPGTIFRLQLDGTYSTVYSFRGGADGSQAYKLLRGADGTVYAVVYASVDQLARHHVLRIAPDGTVTPNVASFEGSVLALTQNGRLLGTVAAQGQNPRRIFMMGLDGTVEYRDAPFQFTELIETSGGVLVGLVPSGSDACQVVRLAPHGSATVLARFDGVCWARLRETSSGHVVGAALRWNGATAFSIGPDGSVSRLVDGQNVRELVPRATGGLLALRGAGSTLGDHGDLIVVSDSGSWSTLAAFPHGNADGAMPNGQIVQDADGDLYGTTSRGGAFDCGTIYRLSRTGEFRTIYHFTGRGDGRNPQGLVQAPTGAIFGSTRAGDTHSGTVFRVGRSGALTTLAVFRRDADGYWPGPLTVGGDGQLYGRTLKGGSHGYGTFFRVTQAGALTVLHDFGREDNLPGLFFNSNTRLLLGSDGNFYGTTNTASSYAPPYGTIFRLTHAGALTVLAIAEYENPSDQLIDGVDGRLYGTFYRDVFAITLEGGLTRCSTALDNTTLSARGPDGNLWGWAFENSTWTLLRMTPTGVMTPIRLTPPLLGGELINGGDGFLYGGSGSALDDGVGSLFKILPPGVPGRPGPPRNPRIVRP